MEDMLGYEVQNLTIEPMASLQTWEILRALGMLYARYSSLGIALCIDYMATEPRSSPPPCSDGAWRDLRLAANGLAPCGSPPLAHGIRDPTTVPEPGDGEVEEVA